MESNEKINIYECFNQDGDPTHYICWGHVDSELFRKECIKEYSVRPLVVQHKWQYTRKVAYKAPGKNRVLGRFHSFECTKDRKNASAITIGIVPQKDSIEELSEIEIN